MLLGGPIAASGRILSGYIWEEFGGCGTLRGISAH